MKTTKKVLFTGKVQGVCFRYTSNRIISHFPLTGYVKNIEPKTIATATAPVSVFGDTVEMILQGESEIITQAVKRVYEYFGGGHIEKITTKTVKTKKYKDFSIDYGPEKSYSWQNHSGGAINSAPGFSAPLYRPQERKCSHCRFMTIHNCPDCKEPLCSFCKAAGRHKCDPKKVQAVKKQVEEKEGDYIWGDWENRKPCLVCGVNTAWTHKINGLFVCFQCQGKQAAPIQKAVLDSQRQKSGLEMEDCTECTGWRTTGRCGKCGVPLCNACKKGCGHVCKVEIVAPGGIISKVKSLFGGG